MNFKIEGFKIRGVIKKVTNLWPSHDSNYVFRCWAVYFVSAVSFAVTASIPFCSFLIYAM